MSNNSDITYPRILPTGDRALSVEFGNEIDEHINSKVTGFIKLFEDEKIDGIEEFVPSYRSVLIHYNPQILSYERMVRLVEAILDKNVQETVRTKRIVQIPVCYEDEYAPDIDFVAEHAGLSVDKVVQIHTSKAYLIYMLGFQPGFPYLGGLDERIHTPRLASPRTKINAGSIGIGGTQTGLYPMESPGGWQIIGTTPVRCYNPDKDPAIPYLAGDYIQFIPISQEEFLKIKETDEKGEYEFTVMYEEMSSHAGKKGGIE